MPPPVAAGGVAAQGTCEVAAHATPSLRAGGGKVVFANPGHQEHLSQHADHYDVRPMEDELAGVNRRIAAVIRDRRRALGVTLAELATSAGLSRTILGRIETGRGNPSVETLFRIARALGLPL